ncbi:MAG TPA: NAD(P)H-hydrate dehydratase, partial [Pseudomonas sp.]|nr:NAD(P)H-hydrate dehydratase [Pseudomonas sp.]
AGGRLGSQGRGLAASYRIPLLRQLPAEQSPCLK